MRRLIAFALALAAVSLVSIVPAHAAEKGTIRGRVISGATGKPEAGAEVLLEGGREDRAGRIHRSTSTDARGRFSFDGLETGEEWFYLVDAVVDGGLFAGRALTLPSDTSKPPVIDTVIRGWDTTSDPTVIGITRHDVFLVPSDGGVAVIESVSILNSSEFAYIGRAPKSDVEARPSIGFAVPPEAEDVQILDSDLDIPELIPADFGFAATIAIPPDAHRTTFSYRLPTVAAQYDISRPILYPTAKLAVYAQPPLTLESNRLADAGEESIEGTRYRVWESDEDFDSGDTLQLLAIAEAGTPVALMAGIAAFVALVLAGGAFALRRARRAPVTRPRAPRPDRDAVLTAIARLDLDYQSGKVDAAAWERERARLKEQLPERQPSA